MNHLGTQAGTLCKTALVRVHVQSVQCVNTDCCRWHATFGAELTVMRKVDNFSTCSPHKWAKFKCFWFDIKYPTIVFSCIACRREISVLAIRFYKMFIYSSTLTDGALWRFCHRGQSFRSMMTLPTWAVDMSPPDVSWQFSAHQSSVFRRTLSPLRNLHAEINKFKLEEWEAHEIDDFRLMCYRLNLPATAIGISSSGVS